MSSERFVKEESERTLHCREIWLNSPRKSAEMAAILRFSFQTGPEKMSRRLLRPDFLAIFSGGPHSSPVSTIPGECNAIRNRWFGERLLDF